MPVVDNRQTRRFSPFVCVAYGCFAVIFLAVVAWIGLQFIVLPKVTSALLGGSRPAGKRGGPYTFDGRGLVPSCSVPLPDGSGTIIYMHGLGGGKGLTPYEGARAVRIDTKAFKGIDLPMEYYAPPNVRVGFYWYPAKDGKGPYLRTYDACEESLIDLKHGTNLRLHRLKGSVYAGQYVTGAHRSYTPFYYKTDSSGKPYNVIVNSRPAKDLTAELGRNKGTYIGSAVRDGNTLKFVPATPKAAEPQVKSQ